MADEGEGEGGGGGGGESSGGGKKKIIIIVAVVLLLIIGIVVFLMMSGDEEEQLPEEELPVTDVAEPLAEPIFLPLESFVVNLKDGRRFLKASIQLMLSEPGAAAYLTVRLVEVKDIVLALHVPDSSKDFCCSAFTYHWHHSFFADVWRGRRKVTGRKTAGDRRGGAFCRTYFSSS